MNIQRISLLVLLSVTLIRAGDKADLERISNSIQFVMDSLDELSDKINAREEKLEVLGRKTKELLESYYELKKAELAHKYPNQDVFDHLINDIGIALQRDLKCCCESIFESGNSVGDLSFRNVESTEDLYCVLLKIASARSYYERMMLAQFVAAWETCAKELMRLFELKSILENKK